MKILICYFSGTGNTKKIVDKYKEEFEKLSIEITIHKIEEPFFNYNLDDFDLFGLAYPIHAFNAPSIVLNFLKTLPKQENKKRVFILKTSGEPLSLNNISSLKAIKILRKKNCYLTNEYHYVMPYNIIFRHSDNMAFKMWDTAQNIIPIDCLEILNNKKAKLKHVFLGSFIAWIFRIEFWGGRFNGKKYKVNEKCIKCQRCINFCPTHNIKIENGKICFGRNCIMCMRCSFFCPTNAIKIGLFDKWKVNGPYNFNNYNEDEKESHNKYCKKSYQKYFSRCEKKFEDINKK